MVIEWLMIINFDFVAAWNNPAQRSGSGGQGCTVTLVCKLSVYNKNLVFIPKSKHWALNREVRCYFRLNLEIGWTRAIPSWKHWRFTRNYTSLHTGVPYNTHWLWPMLEISRMSRLNDTVHLYRGCVYRQTFYRAFHRLVI